MELYKLPSFAPEHEFSSNGAGEPTAVALSPDDSVLALATAGTEFAVLEKHEKGVSALAFTTNGKALISDGPTARFASGPFPLRSEARDPRPGGGYNTAPFPNHGAGSCFDP